MDSVRGFFAEKLKLNLSLDKTRVVPLQDGFDFLGFHIRRARLERGKCVRIRPTQRNLIRLKGKLQAMLGSSARNDDPMMKVAAMNRVLRGWSNYYRAVNSYQQFKTGDFLANRLFRRWYCRRYQIGVRKYLATIHATGTAVIRRGDVKVELYRMASNKSAHTALNHKAVWKYRSIKNPYINATNTIAGVSEVQDNPILDIREVQPLAPEYNDETYLTNRLVAFERDGWKCTQCGSRENLQAHHIEPVPRGTFDPNMVHRIENLQTLCADCHQRLPKPDQCAS